MLTRVAWVMALLAAVGCAGATVGNALETIVITADGTRVEYPELTAKDLLGAGCPGEKRSLCLLLKNWGKRVVRIPVPSLGTGEPVVSLRVRTQDGAEEVTYLGDGQAHGSPRVAPSAPPLVVIPPGEEAILDGWVVPWAPGEHSYTMEVGNAVTRRGVVRRKVTPRGNPYREEVPETIPDVWVGKFRIEGSFLVHDEETDQVREALAELKGAALDPKRPLAERCDALATLAGLRHIYATEALEAIEAKTRDDEDEKERMERPQEPWPDSPRACAGRGHVVR